MTNDRLFPVLLSHLAKGDRSIPFCPLAIPWRLVEPHARQVQINHSQTVERLAQRGGLSPGELQLVLTDQPFNGITFSLPRDRDAYIRHECLAIEWLNGWLAQQEGVGDGQRPAAVP